MKEFIARNLCWLALILRQRKTNDEPLNASNPPSYQYDKETKKFNDAIGKIYHLE